ncbi:ArsR/SmtB family transcription factor [Undibacterium arcticum]|uniref:ArsR/SmtB family transcription factor n=1 Tax=Undibacterium arcticum TaxID=1762892 RepID=A0ABV7F832_9BURK
MIANSNPEPDLSRLARTVGDPSRIRMLTLLMEGRALTAKELAYGAGVEPATASAHLRRLEEDAFVSKTAQGRHKYFRLASPQVAQLVEALMVMSPQAQPQRTGANQDAPIRLARFCYDHLAGRLGTGLTAILLERGLLSIDGKAFAVTAAGESWFQSFGIDLGSLRSGRRQFAHQCLDWTERKDHLAGALGAAIAQRLLELGWITRQKSSRVVSITESGQHGLQQQFGLSLRAAA